MSASTYPLDRFLNIRAAAAPAFSPDGRFVAYLTNTTGVAQLWQVPIEGGWPVQLTFTHESVRGAWYCPTRLQLIFSMDAGGNERTQLFQLTGIEGEKTHSLGEGWDYADITKHPKAIHQFGGYSHDGKHIAFSANRTRDNRFDIYVQSLAGGGRKPAEEARLVAEGPGGYYSALGWSPDDNAILVSRSESNFNQDLYLVYPKAEGSNVRHLTPHKGDVQYESPRWSADGKAVYCTSTHGGRDRSGLAKIDVASGKVEFIETPEHEVEGVEVSHQGRWLAWRVNVDGKSVLKLRDLKANKALEPQGLPLGVISGLEFSLDGEKLAFTFDGPRHNSDIWLWDLRANQLRQLTHSSRAGIPFSTFVEPELVHYKSFDGRLIPGWFYAPRAEPPHPRRLSPKGERGDERLPPVIVYPHGGPESQTRPNFSALFQYFIQRGYGVFAPNVRGSSGYGTAYMNLDNTVKRMDSVKDLAAGVRWLGENKKADPKRIAVYGGSYGGFMVLAGVTHYPDHFAAGIDVVGICNFVTFLENTGPYRRAHREAEYGNLREHREFFEKISPIHHVDKIQCPMMVIHGANDPRVPVGEAEQIVAALRKRGIPVEYLRYEDEGHGLAKLRNRLDAYPKMVDFLDKHLK